MIQSLKGFVRSKRKCLEYKPGQCPTSFRHCERLDPAKLVAAAQYALPLFCYVHIVSCKRIFAQHLDVNSWTVVQPEPQQSGFQA